MPDDIQKFTRILPVDLTDGEIQNFGRELAAKLGDIEEIEDRLALAKEQAKDAKKPIFERIEELRRMLDAKSKDKPVECEQHFDFATNTVEYYRLDTSARYDVRPMTPEERQRPLPFAKDQEG